MQTAASPAARRLWRELNSHATWRQCAWARTGALPENPLDLVQRPCFVRLSAIPDEQCDGADGEQSREQLMPSASVDVMEPARGHGKCRQKDGKIPKRRDGFVSHKDIDYTHKNGNDDNEEVGIPEFRAAGPAGKVHVISEKACNRFTEVHRRRRVSETIDAGWRRPQDKQQWQADNDQNYKPMPYRETAHDFPPNSAIFQAIDILPALPESITDCIRMSICTAKSFREVALVPQHSDFELQACRARLSTSVWGSQRKRWR
ncbi:hypothetical protein MPL1032_50245 [Mesorhizobium plurifarium]|uniref:Uncharacterized protein n=1 Tax=Mesorhizobium plurifarium TaxID=69974 RepID=A0A0K2W6D7_MESPL|nr:hypothetical protein MPL1032_50245 [Mesorhizobium plurifarium]